MTVILAGADWTMWPGLNPQDFDLDISTAGIRDHTRVFYSFRNSGVNFERVFEPIVEGWFGAYCRAPISDAFNISGNYIEFLDENDVVIFYLYRDDIHLDFDAPFLSERVRLINFDTPPDEIAIQFNIDSQNGFVRAYSRGVQRGSFSGDTQGSSNGQLSKVKIYRGGSSFSSRSIKISEFLISTEPTINFKVIDQTLLQGAVSQWDGDVSNITDVGYASTEDSLSTETPDNLASFARPSIPALEGDEYIAAVTVGVSILAETDSPVDEADLVVYDDATEYGAERVAPGTSFEEFYHVWNENPATSQPWTEQEANDFEVGVAARSS